ncbi:hypothetical protein, partial [Staphylococcus aureus]|uniref:hypothetical protein n=1 Tax=Staphylococcus aureus TaxID=1280 RepID=UPI0021B26150
RRNADVDEGKANGEGGINGVRGKVVKKEGGKDEIDELEGRERNVMNNDEKGRNEEKEGGIEELARAVREAKNNIRAGSDDNGV